MSVSLNKVVSILSERVDRPFDIPFQEELKDIFVLWMATIRRQSLERNPRDRRYMLQSFTMELEKVPLIECPIEYGCVLRTKFEIPTALRSNGILFDYIGLPTWDTPFGYTDESLEMFMAENQYTGKKIRYAYRDNKAYIYNTKTLQYIGVKGVFEDPRSLDGLKCNSVDCYSDDLPFPATDDMIQQAISAILKTELASEFRSKLPIDDSNVDLNIK